MRERAWQSAAAALAGGWLPRHREGRPASIEHLCRVRENEMTVRHNLCNLLQCATKANLQENCKLARYLTGGVSDERCGPRGMHRPPSPASVSSVKRHTPPPTFSFPNLLVKHGPGRAHSFKAYDPLRVERVRKPRWEHLRSPHQLEN